MRTVPFYQRILPAPVGGGFAMEDYWIWCGSVIQGEDGRYHMFASRWPKAQPFAPHWMLSSEVVRAVADRPEGPYEFAGVVLPRRAAEYWDGRMTHNPTIHRCGDTYLLFYTGTTYHFDPPDEKTEVTSEMRREANGNQRIGLAAAPSVTGPWTRRDEPVLQPRPGKWDCFCTTNPAPCVREDGSVLLVYKSKVDLATTLKMGVAGADHYEGPYRRLQDEPLFAGLAEQGMGVEDAYIWWQDDHYEAIMKDMTGHICGEKYAGIHASSDDGIHWEIQQPSLAYSRTITWSDGSRTTQGHLERPQLLVQDGIPTHLFAATGDGSGGFRNMNRTWNMVIPLKH